MHNHLMRRISISISILASILMTLSVVSAQARTVPSTFVKYASSPMLRNPGILVLDPSSNHIIYSLHPDVMRAPASVLKLFSMATTLNTFSPDLVFTTTISTTANPDTFVVNGKGDPWMTSSEFEATKYHRAFLPHLIDEVLAANPSLKTINLEYSGVYTLDMKTVKRFFAGRVTINLVPIASPHIALADAVNPIATVSSPKLADIVQFTLLYSDNILADRLVRAAAKQLGFGSDAVGIKSAIDKTLSDLKINSTGLSVQDGNGLSHATRVSVRQVVDLLIAIKSDPKFQVIYDGLPTAGETGTLKTRFVKDAPNAVGLVHAKTGWIDTTVSLAGYVRVRAREYVFAVVANHIRNHETAREDARVTIDKMLGTIARPLN